MPEANLPGRFLGFDSGPIHDASRDGEQSDRQAGANRITCLVGDETGALPIGQVFKVSRLVSDADRSHVYRPS